MCNRFRSWSITRSVAEIIRLILQRQDELEKEIKDLGISTDIVKINGFLSKKSEIEEIFSEGAGI